MADRWEPRTTADGKLYHVNKAMQKALWHEDFLKLPPGGGSTTEAEMMAMAGAQHQHQHQHQQPPPPTTGERRWESNTLAAAPQNPPTPGGSRQAVVRPDGTVVYAVDAAWVAVRRPGMAREYYVHRATRETRWEHPLTSSSPSAQGVYASIAAAASPVAGSRAAYTSPPPPPHQQQQQQHQQQHYHHHHQQPPPPQPNYAQNIAAVPGMFGSPVESHDSPQSRAYAPQHDHPPPPAFAPAIPPQQPQQQSPPQQTPISLSQPEPPQAQRWLQAVDPTSGEDYYICLATGETTWEWPEGEDVFALPLPKQPNPNALALATASPPSQKLHSSIQAVQAIKAMRAYAAALASPEGAAAANLMAAAATPASALAAPQTPRPRKGTVMAAVQALNAARARRR
ncbi:hypothetical protein NFJ02_17g27080 [Pycnococcus provasolii]